MKVTSIHLTNFRSHADTQLSCERLTVIRGANHTGKSSIAYALEYLFAGRCPGTASDGKGAAKLVREGAKKARIRVEAMGAVSESAIDAKGSRSGDESLPDRDIFSCLTNTAYLYSMTPAEQKNLLSKLVLPTEHTWPAWVPEYIAHTGLDESLNGDLVRVIDSIYKAAFDERTVVNRTLKGFVVPSGDTAAAKSPEATKDVEERLAKLRQELTDLTAKQRTSGSALREHQTKVEAASERMNRASAALSREEQELPGIKGRILSKKRLEEQQKIAAGAAKRTDLSAKLAVAEVDYAAKRSLMEKLRKMEPGTTCDRCHQEITEDVVVALYATVEKEYNALGETIHNLRDEIASLGDAAGAQQAIAAHAAAVNDEKRANERITEAQKELNAAKSAFQALPEPPAPGEDFTAQITETQQRISKGEGIILAIKSANALVERQQQAERERAQLEKKQEMLERLVEEFGPKGVKARLLDENIGGFQDAMNKVLAAWGYQCELNFEPFQFSVRTTSGIRELSLLSESEAHRWAVAFQVALAEWSGHRFVVVDRADVLDQESRKALMNMLWKSDLDQAIVSGTDERMEAKQKDGVSVYRFDMNDEKITTVERLA